MSLNRRSLRHALLALALGGLLAGCSSTKLDEAPVESRPVPTDGSAAGRPGAGTTCSTGSTG